LNLSGSVESTLTLNLRDVPVFILCGGLGTRLREQTEFRPKPMALIGEHPILWHIMTSYAAHGFSRFVLCMGYKSEIIRDYFLNFYAMNADITVNLGTNETTIHSVNQRLDWEVTLAYTGEKTMTGARIARAAASYLGDAHHFAVTYGDGLTDVDLAREFDWHIAHQKLGTVLGVNPPSRFGEFRMSGDQLTDFAEKPEIDSVWINGGYFFFRREFIEHLSADESCILEREALSQLARQGQLSVFRHQGYWACMDTQRDWETLNNLWSSGAAPWKPAKRLS
jgi:glucose-1-phosphate cytidylyltransferase